jgi:hypothetical protein
MSIVLVVGGLVVDRGGKRLRVLEQRISRAESSQGHRTVTGSHEEYPWRFVSFHV